MTRFFRDYSDTSSETISEAASFLNRKPKRQGSNQSLDEVVTSAKSFTEFLSANPMNAGKKGTYFSPYNKNVSSDDIHQGLKHSEAVRKAINHPNAGPEHFEKVLSGDFNPHIKRDIANHPNATKDQKQRALEVDIPKREDPPVDDSKLSARERASITSFSGPGSKNVKPTGY